jgi:hypothetical protein
MNANRMSQAMVSANEYSGLVLRGDVTMAEQVRRDLDTLVGRWVDGRWVYPAEVAIAMCRPDLGPRPG